MTRLRLLISAVVVVDTMLFAALVPLLPDYVADFGLSKTGAGALVAAYPAGALVGAMPGGYVASRFGPKRAVLAGLVLVALASLGLGFAGDSATFGLARFAQGLGSTFSWAGALAWLVAGTPRDRRGEILGGAIGSAVFGSLLGPVLGAVASVAGTARTFGGVAALALFLAAVAAASEGVSPERQPLREIVPALRERSVLAALWLTVLPALLFGLFAVLVPLRLDAAGWAATSIGLVYLVASAVEMVAAPAIGRASDRRGRRLPLELALAASVLVTLALAWAGPALLVAALLVVAAIATGSFWGPAMALLADAAERVGLAQGLSFGLMNAAWAAGNAVGPAAGGGLADAAGDAVPFSGAALVCLVTLTALLWTRSSGTRTLRVPEGP